VVPVHYLCCPIASPPTFLHEHIQCRQRNIGSGCLSTSTTPCGIGRTAASVAHEGMARWWQQRCRAGITLPGCTLSIPVCSQLLFTIPACCHRACLYAIWQPACWAGRKAFTSLLRAAFCSVYAATLPWRRCAAVTMQKPAGIFCLSYVFACALRARAFYAVINITLFGRYGAAGGRTFGRRRAARWRQSCYRRRACLALSFPLVAALFSVPALLLIPVAATLAWHLPCRERFAPLTLFSSSTLRLVSSLFWPRQRLGVTRWHLPSLLPRGGGRH